MNTNGASPTSSGSAVASPSAAPSTMGGPVFSISAEDAGRAGLPKIGMRFDWSEGSWSETKLPAQYFSASGPPGGPQSFGVSPYQDDEATRSIEAHMRRLIASWSGKEPFVVGPTETVELGGKSLAAQSFRVGSSMATSGYCVLKAPSPSDPKAGALVMFGGGIGETTTPSCKLVLERSAFTKIRATFAWL